MALIIEIKIVPQSGKSQLIVDKSGILKCFVKAAPEKGKANKELIDIISKQLQIPKRNMLIISGATSRKKLIKIETDLKYEQLLTLLGSGVQKNILE